MSSSDDDYEGAEGIIGRKMVFCDRLQSFETDKLIMTCPDCRGFFLYCCCCSTHHSEAPLPCHHFRLVFSDGACRLNGQLGATSGIGILYGEDTKAQQAIPITSSLDPGQKRTSQRAELLAALAALQFIAEADRLHGKEAKKKDGPRSPGQSEKAWVIATDSEYVVKGMTEWLRTWKVTLTSHHQLPESTSIYADFGGQRNGLRTNRGTKPANLDLFLKLDAAITTHETGQDLKIGFWHIRREYNTLADALAKEASTQGNPE